MKKVMASVILSLAPAFCRLRQLAQSSSIQNLELFPSTSATEVDALSIIFKLLDQGCLETMPMQCSYKLDETIKNGPDLCESIISRTITFFLRRTWIK